MKYAHLENYTNKLLGWYDSDIHDEVPTPNIEVSESDWQSAIEINANCYEDGAFIVKDFRTSEEIEKNKRSSINENYENEVSKLTLGVPNSEISTWTKQESEARSYKIDNQAATPLISSLAEQRGVSLDYLADKIIEKADAYSIAIGTLTGVRQKAQDDLI